MPSYSEMLHVGPENIEEGTGRLFNARPAKDIGLISGKYLFDAADVLYSKIRPYLRKAALPEFAGICSADMYPLRPVNGSLSREFLYCYLLSEKFTLIGNRKWEIGNLFPLAAGGQFRMIFRAYDHHDRRAGRHWQVNSRADRCARPWI